MLVQVVVVVGHFDFEVILESGRNQQIECQLFRDAFVDGVDRADQRLDCHVLNWNS